MFEGFAALRRELTGIVFLRRISRELRRMNDLMEERFAIEHPAHYKASGRKGKTARVPKLATDGISHPTVENWNDNFRKTHPDTEEEDVFNHP